MPVKCYFIPVTCYFITVTQNKRTYSGGGPVGLMSALELNKQGIKAILIEKNPRTTQHPKMDITNGRSMELFRRRGVDK